jgi:hypothetical protein
MFKFQGYSGPCPKPPKARLNLGEVVDAGPLPKIGSRWRHRKGALYEVVSNARLEGTLEAVVVYRDEAVGMTWVRPLSEFIDGRFTALNT